MNLIIEIQIVFSKFLRLLFCQQRDSYNCLSMQVEEFQVLEIIDKRMVSHGNTQSIEYKVLWKGYSAKDATWEPIENMQGCQTLIQEFEDKQRKRKETKLQNPKPQAQKPKVPQKDVNTLQRYGFVQSNPVDFYFEDESDPPPKQDEPKEPQKMQVNQASNKQDEVILDLKPAFSPEVKEKKKKKKKKEHDEAQIERMDIEHKQAEIKKKEPTLYTRNPEDVLTYIMEQETVKPSQRFQSSSVQTDSLDSFDIMPFQDSEVKVISMHSSREFPDKTWFTVSTINGYYELPLQQLYQQYPRALYTFYHEYYLISSNKAKEAEQFAEKMFRKYSKSKSQEDLSSEEDCSIDYSEIVNVDEDPYTHSKFEKYVRNEIKKKLKAAKLQKSLRK